MEIRTQTSLLAAVLCVAIATTVLMRARRLRMHWLFSFFALSIGCWYLTTFLAGAYPSDLWIRANLVCAVVLPVAGVQFFRAFIDEYTLWMSSLHRASLAFAVTLSALIIFTPLYGHIALKTAVFTYLLAMLVAPLLVVYRRGQRASSRVEGARLRYLALVGALAATFTMADYLQYVGLDLPPVGTVLTLIFLYVLSQSILRFRLLDLYELAGRLGVLTALSFTLAFFFFLAVQVSGGGFFLPSVVAAMVVLLLFDPVRAKVEDNIAQFFFRERFDFEQAMGTTRRRIARALTLDDLASVILDGLEQSRRITHASIYFLDRDEKGYDLAGHRGPTPARRIELAPARPFIDRLRREDHLILENLDHEIEEQESARARLEVETLLEVRSTLEAMFSSVCLAIRGEEGEIYGLIAVRDERLRDAFSPEEVALLRGMATQASIAIENSRAFQFIKERDRLAALGEMAAGLAHEIRNPLGAIKASAQFLHGPDAERDTRSLDEFLGIIVDEVDRLNRVVSSFLDFARPSQGNPAKTDVNAAVERTMQLLGAECEAARVHWTLTLDPTTPEVRIDVEQLRQVVINLVRNAVQAMGGAGGKLELTTARRTGKTSRGTRRDWVELRVGDSGPGIPEKVMTTLFVPFVTTKESGTGLGLSITHRIVSAAGGTIEAKNNAGGGATFIVRLPVNDASSQRPFEASSAGEVPSPGAPPVASPAPRAPS